VHVVNINTMRTRLHAFGQGMSMRLGVFGQSSRKTSACMCPSAWILDKVPVGGWVRILTKRENRRSNLWKTWKGLVDGREVITAEGLSKCAVWTMESARWKFLKHTMVAREGSLVESIYTEQMHQKKLEASGRRSFTWSVLRTVLPCFEAAGRASTPLWGAEHCAYCSVRDPRAQEQQEEEGEEEGVSSNGIIYLFIYIYRKPNSALIAP
jgi:hypothetical protein